MLEVEPIKRLFMDKKGNVVLFQVPNLPILAWIIFLLLAKVLPPGHWRLWAEHLSTIALFVWAALEVGWGVTYFRRALGLVVLIFILVTLF